MSDSAAPASAGGDVAAIVERIARGAGDLALSHFRALADLPVQMKGHLDLVTDADREVEQYLTSELRAAFPADGIYGEENGELPGTSGRIWVIDPIDGTFNFVRGSQNWAISIGLFDERRPCLGVIHAPVRDLTLVGGKSVQTTLNGVALKPLPNLDMSRASTGFSYHPSASTADRIEVVRFISDELKASFRLCGAATLSLMEVAMGETDGYLSLGDSTWDVMAALPILGNLDVVHTIDWDNTDLDAKLRFAAGTEAFLQKVRPLLERVAATA